MIRQAFIFFFGLSKLWTLSLDLHKKEVWVFRMQACTTMLNMHLLVEQHFTETSMDSVGKSSIILTDCGQRQFQTSDGPYLERSYHGQEHFSWSKLSYKYMTVGVLYSGRLYGIKLLCKI